MSAPEHPHPSPPPPTNTAIPPQAAPTNPPPASPIAPSPPGPKVPNVSKVPNVPKELTGFRSALSHTGIPHSVLTWKPKLPSRNWIIFWTITSSITATYYYDRMESKRIKNETIKLVQDKSKEVLQGGSLGIPRKITVYGAKWGGDEDTDRALRYFRKYVKPYLVAAAIDYSLPTAPLHGSITRQVHASILSQRRQALGLEAPPPQLSLPGILTPEEAKQKELEGGIVLVGRASFKEYMEGLKRGWMGDVNDWKWEDEIEKKLENDGVFNETIDTSSSDSTSLDQSIEPSFAPDQVASSTPIQPIKPATGLGFLSRPSPIHQTQVPPSSSSSSTAYQIPSQYHTPPNPLPPQPPILFLPFVNHIGFTQIPQMIKSFFTERYRVKQGSEAALAIIDNHIRPFDETKDLEFDKENEIYYNNAARELHTRVDQAKKDYYESLKPKIDLARQYENGQRELTTEENKSGKVITVNELKEERKKKELRWMGNQEGWDIVKPESAVSWDQTWSGWLNVFQLPKGNEK
ncbi:uncharacterized protein IL334_000436 [Kwoniella shivajii]|uniref:Mitochondrial import inner membrane translocase subunit TIM54 n=1 Tax=Kwoniella shivajii TaxID=564305 RepID=A0ABZ1CS75_9TREE|nr:hypothetical protein IL334_000436 [Kwoniella shivajii]